MTTTTDRPAPGLMPEGDLADLIGELARARAFLTAVRPPVTRHYPATIGHSCSSVAEVDEIAALIGAEATWVDCSTYTTEMPFGANVAYRATFIAKGSEPAGGPQQDRRAAR